MKISLKDTKILDEKDFKAGFYVEKADDKGFNAIFVDCITGHYKTRIKGARRMYFVLEGSGTFTINDDGMTAEPYDLFIIEDGDTYSYRGKMRLFEFNVPATDASNEEKIG